MSCSFSNFRFLSFRFSNSQALSFRSSPFYLLPSVFSIFCNFSSFFQALLKHFSQLFKTSFEKCKKKKRAFERLNFFKSFFNNTKVKTSRNCDCLIMKTTFATTFQSHFIRRNILTPPTRLFSWFFCFSCLTLSKGFLLFALFLLFLRSHKQAKGEIVLSFLNVNKEMANGTAKKGGKEEGGKIATHISFKTIQA